MEPELTMDEVQAVLATKTAPRVTEASIKDKIEAVDYHFDGTLTMEKLLP